MASMIEQLNKVAVVAPCGLNGNEHTFGIAEFAALTPQQQRQTMDRHVEKINNMLCDIKAKLRSQLDARFCEMIEELCIQPLEWADPHRTPGSCVGECSIDLKQRWRLVKYDKDGNVIMATEWFTCYQIALGSTFDDPRVPMELSDIWGTVTDEHGKRVTSMKADKILDEAYKHFKHQGVGKKADLTQRDKVLVGCRASLIWTPSEDETKEGWTVETVFSEFCYQDSGYSAHQNGPKSFGIFMGPKGSAFYSGYAGQLDMPYKFVDEVTGKLMDYPSKVNASDRVIEADGTVRKQTDEEKVNALQDDPWRAVQLQLGVTGLPPSSNMEIVMFGIQKQKTNLFENMSGMSVSGLPSWRNRGVYKTLDEMEQDRIAAEELDAKRKEESCSDLGYGCGNYSDSNDSDGYGVQYRSLSAGKDFDGYRSLAPTSFGDGEVVEAELGLAKESSGRSLRLSVEDVVSDQKKNMVLTQYKKWALPFGTIPGENFLENVVTNLLFMWKACEKPIQGKNGPKTSLGLVDSRHCKKALKTFCKGELPNYADITSGLKHYNTNAKDLLPVVDTDSDDDSDDDSTQLGKAQKLKSEQSPSYSEKVGDSDED